MGYQGREGVGGWGIRGWVGIRYRVMLYIYIPLIIPDLGVLLFLWITTCRTTGKDYPPQRLGVRE